MIWNLPNIISLLRILGLPLLIQIINGHNIHYFLIAFIIFQASDILDGYLARRLNQQTKFGHLLDSIGDLCSYIVAFWSLYTFKHTIFNTSSAIFVFVYVTIIIVRLLLSKFFMKNWFPKIENDNLSKIKFYVQSIGIILVYIDNRFWWLIYITITIGVLHEYNLIKFSFNASRKKNLNFTL